MRYLIAVLLVLSAVVAHADTFLLNPRICANAYNYATNVGENYMDGHTNEDLIMTSITDRIAQLQKGLQASNLTGKTAMVEALTATWYLKENLTVFLVDLKRNKNRMEELGFKMDPVARATDTFYVNCKFESSFQTTPID